MYVFVILPRVLVTSPRVLVSLVRRLFTLPCGFAVSPRGAGALPCGSAISPCGAGTLPHGLVALPRAGGVTLQAGRPRRCQHNRQPSKLTPNFGSWADRLHAVLGRCLSGKVCSQHFIIHGVAIGLTKLMKAHTHAMIHQSRRLCHSLIEELDDHLLHL